MDPSTNPEKSRPRRRGVLAIALLPLTLALGLLGGAPAGASPDSSVGKARTSVPLPDGLQPEGITSGPGTTYYAGSLNDGRIITGDLGKGTSAVLLPGSAGRQLRGMQWDSRTNLLWAAGNVGSVAHVYAVNASTGRIRADVVVPGAVFLNDVVITDGKVWVTDSMVDRLTSISLTRAGWVPPAPTPAFVELGGDWPAFDGSAINANGIRELPDGSLVLNNSRVGGLWRVSPTTGNTTEIPVSGASIVSGDGLERHGLVLYDVRGTGLSDVSVLQLRRSGGSWTATGLGTLTDPRLDVPATATFAGGSLWAVNARFGTPDPAAATYSVTRLPARP